MPPRERLLEWIEVRGFRAFRRLRVDGLARVNLLVGKNNVGKTTLLEAIQVLVTSGAQSTLASILSARDENLDGQGSEDVDPADSPLLSLFHGRHDPGHASEIVVRSNLGELRARLALYREDAGGQLVEREWVELSDPSHAGRTEEFPVLAIKGKTTRLVRLDRLFPPKILREPADLWETCKFISHGGVAKSECWRMWDKVVLTSTEDDVVRSLEFIAPGIERLSFVGSEAPGASRTAKVRVKHFDRAVPLKSLGDGVNRVLGLVLALATTKNGVVLVDEIENGIHYSVQENLWNLLINAAEHFNVQIFATTHSSDSIRAFQLAANKATGENGALIRLERRGEDIVASRFSEEELATADRAHVEVR